MSIDRFQGAKNTLRSSDILKFITYHTNPKWPPRWPSKPIYDNTQNVKYNYVTVHTNLINLVSKPRFQGEKTHEYHIYIIRQNIS